MRRLGLRRRKRIVRRAILPVAMLSLIAASGVFAWAAPELRDHLGSQAVVGTRYAERLGSCRATDGDTIRCGSERIRLLGIDAPELPGHCGQGRNCAPGDPYASTASLKEAMSGEMTIERVGEDYYGRTLALVASAKGDLSCWQLSQKQVIYKPRWDNGLRVARTCPGATLG